jgi:hypothetical protein
MFLRTPEVPGLFDPYKSVKRDHGGSGRILSGGPAPPRSGGPRFRHRPKRSARSLVGGGHRRYRRSHITELEARVAAATGLNQLLQAGSIERSYDRSSYIR